MPPSRPGDMIGDAPPRDPHEWRTGDEPMTAAQRAAIETLSRQLGEDFDPDEILTRAEAALRISELRRRARRGMG
ncbi:MAG TPA: DUF3072 domain-containing protein [Steroidobacteraceae bacterium]